MCDDLTLMFPPPGEWLTLSMEPTFDWAFTLKFTLWDSIFTSPPPAVHMGNQSDDHTQVYTFRSMWEADTVSTQPAWKPVLRVKPENRKSYVLTYNYKCFCWSWVRLLTPAMMQSELMNWTGVSLFPPFPKVFKTLSDFLFNIFK